jgi:hydroxyacylglutathione hydrolase
VVDVRADLQFAEAHIPGAVLVTALRPGFGTKLAWILASGQRVVFVGRDDGDGLRATRLAAAVGVREVAGYLSGGMTTWREEGRPVARMERLSVADLVERRRVDPALQILDVREDAEWASARIPGSVHTPYHDVRAVPDGIDPARPIAVVCASGQRSAVAASLLQRFGARDVLHVVGGGVGTWGRAGWPISRD